MIWPGSSAALAYCSIFASSWNRVSVFSWSALRFSGFFFGISLVPEVHVLQRLLDLEAPDERDRFLQVVALFAADAELVALDRGLDLQLRVLDRLHDLLGELLVDALLDHDLLALGIARSALRILKFQSAGIELAPGDIALQQLLHLLQLHFVIGEEGDDLFLALDGAFRTLEIEPGVDLAPGAVDGVVDLGQVGLGNDIEGWHVEPLGACLVAGPDSATKAVSLPTWP